MITAIRMITSKESEALLAILERVLIAFSVMFSGLEVNGNYLLQFPFPRDSTKSDYYMNLY